MKSVQVVVKGGRRYLFISFSGGETSAFMTLWCIRHLSHLYEKVVVVFANTGQENEETLEFVRAFSAHYSVEVIWVEAVIHPRLGDGTTHKIVSFETAARNGEPFEEMIKKFGIPNPDWLHCTRELKTNPMYDYIRSIGWKKKDFNVAIGLRTDEIGRASNDADKKGIIYPLISLMPSMKIHINEFWESQPFRLNLKGYQGNCKTCWKKSLRNLLTIAVEAPEKFDFFESMEEKHGLAGANPQGKKRVFNRDFMTIKELRVIASTGHFTPADDDSRIYPEPALFGYKLDVNSSCAQACEVLFDDFEDAA